MAKLEMSEPREKAPAMLLSRYAWHGTPVPPGEPGPWMIGSTCWYVTVQFRGRGQKLFAAETSEQAVVAARAFIDNWGT